MKENRLTFLVLVALGIFGAGFVLYMLGSGLYESIVDRENQITKLKTERAELGVKRMTLEKEKKAVDRVRATALPGNVQLATNVYKGFLRELLLKHKFAVTTFTDSAARTSTGGQRGQASAMNVISYKVNADATLPNLVGFLQDFYRHNLPHEIRSFVVEPLGRGNAALNKIELEVEVLSMSNVPDRESVFPVPDPRIALGETMSTLYGAPSGILVGINQFSPSGLFGSSKLAAEIRPGREYSAMLNKNVFSGLAPKDPAAPNANRPPDKSVLKDTVLTSITANYVTERGLLWVQPTNKFVDLRAEGGINAFEVKDANDQVVLRGKVLAIKPRDLVFEADGKLYAMHIGEKLEQAMKKELTSDDLKRIDPELVSLLDAREAKETAETAEEKDK
jgi:hypothetical protein